MDRSRGGHRFYIAAQGRWASRDPIGEDGGILLYTFAANSPILAYDAQGLLTLSWSGTLTSENTVIYNWRNGVRYDIFGQTWVDKWDVDPSEDDADCEEGCTKLDVEGECVVTAWYNPSHATAHEHEEDRVDAWEESWDQMGDAIADLEVGIPTECITDAKSACYADLVGALAARWKQFGHVKQAEITVRDATDEVVAQEGLSTLISRQWELSSLDAEVSRLEAECKKK